ncbi:MAG: hypothetical protein Q8K50_02335 [Hydrogenophaga sp.]|nr:hypothetical protein [Hydrogenophaga sp.]
MAKTEAPATAPVASNSPAVVAAEPVAPSAAAAKSDQAPIV